MIRLGLGLIALSVLVACGVDGPPVRPTAGVNVGVGTRGVNVGVGGGVRVGGVNLGVGLGL
ncbi:argininosuccinate lyase [Roseovarius sp.]|uniref:argininosuccinate lyase n=1 Tax=Roseovarius sp. TaxID=1486281 RepID=UPI003A977F08